MDNIEKRQAGRRRGMTRRQFLYGGAGVVASGGVAMGYGFGVEPDLIRVRRVTLPVQNLPAAFHGLRVLQITDLHYQQGEDDRLMEKVVQAANALNADVVLHTGDYVEPAEKALVTLTIRDEV